MHFSKLFLPFACLHLQAEATTQVIGNALPRFPSLGNLLPFGNKQKRPKPSYGPPKPGNSSKGKPSYKPKPSYGPPKGREKPSYKPKPSYGPPKARRPSYKPQGGNGGGRKPSYRPSSSGGSGGYQNSVTNLQPPSPTSSHQGPGESSITDYEMKELLVSIHNMMEQIVANTGSGAVSSAQSAANTQANSAPDSYGNPLAPPTSGSSQGPSSTGAGQGTSAPDSYGNPLGSPIRSRPASSSPVSSSDSYGLAQAAVIDNTQTVGSYSSTGQDPVIRSTLEQISKALRQYRDTETGIDERSLQDGVEKKPVRFPRNPSFSDILQMLEEKRLQKLNTVGGRKIQEDKFLERSGTEEEPSKLSLDVFF